MLAPLVLFVQRTTTSNATTGTHTGTRAEIEVRYNAALHTNLLVACFGLLALNCCLD